MAANFKRLNDELACSYCELKGVSLVHEGLYVLSALEEAFYVLMDQPSEFLYILFHRTEAFFLLFILCTPLCLRNSQT